MINNFSLLQIKEQSSSLLRERFEGLEGKTTLRSVNVEYVTPEIHNLKERPAFYPNISLFQYKKINDDNAYIFSEHMQTSNEFLQGFEQFIRAHMIEIPAENFEDVPESYQHFFQTPYTLTPCNYTRVEISPVQIRGKISKIAHDTFQGIDHTIPCTLRMIAPEILFKKISKIEKIANFSATIEKKCCTTSLQNDQLIGHEERKGNECVTTHHYVFTTRESY